MRRILPLLLVCVLLASACSNRLGRSTPECDDIGNTLVLEVQSVPGAAYVACINGLRAGWDYVDLEARSGRSVFWLDSDRMGERFLTIETLSSCNVGPAQTAPSGYPEIDLYKNVSRITTVDIVVVPEGPTGATTNRARQIASELDDLAVHGRTTVVGISDSDEPTAVRIDRAAATGAHVIAIGIRDVEEGTLSLRLGGTADERRIVGLDDVIEDIEEVEAPPSYRGNWYYQFDGGCVRYTFDAEGSGVRTIERDVELALGFFDAESLRQLARDLGYNLP